MDPDHFSASFEPDPRPRRPKHSGKPALSGQKDRPAVEQNAVVAAPSQLRTITAPALPRSNQIDATLFDFMS
jgi:hypothetical protein